MPSPPDVFQILKIKRQPKMLINLKQVSSDQTSQQRKLYYSVASELLRKDAGENDIFIKFVNNFPTTSKNGQRAQQQ